jgi:hypothetical protein
VRWTQGASIDIAQTGIEQSLCSSCTFCGSCWDRRRLAIVAGLIYMGRRQEKIRDARQREMNWDQAAELRRDVKDAALDAQEAKVRASRSQLAAEQATGDVERLRVKAERQQHVAQACGLGGQQNEQSLFSVGFAGKQGEYGPILLAVEIGHGSLFKESHNARVDIRFFGD